jgi:hypothetical protein
MGPSGRKKAICSEYGKFIGSVIRLQVISGYEDFIVLLMAMMKEN